MNNEKQTEIKNKAKEFAESILKCPEYKEFIENSEKFDNNSEAQNLLNGFQQKQAELRYNGFSSEIMEELKEIQIRINQNKIIRDFTNSRENLIELLRRTNNIISAQIGTKFALSSGGGCCG